MNIDKLDNFILELSKKSQKDLDETLEYFKLEFPKFRRDEREILSGIISGMGLGIAYSKVSMRKKLYWMVMEKYCEKPIAQNNFVENIEDDIFPRMALGEGINGNQITKMFHELKENGVILGSYELIAEAISTIFQIEYSTAYKDLTQPRRLLKVKVPIQ